MTLPPDQTARNQIETSLTENLFVEAGAGAGKTTSLVARLVSLVAAGVDLERVAAITFTEAAAAELRHRLRHALITAARDATPDEHERFTRALDQLDHAAIGTLHAFARRLLNEFPIASGLPPGFAVLDEIESNIRFDHRWEAFIDALLAWPGALGDEPSEPRRGAFDRHADSDVGRSGPLTDRDADSAENELGSALYQLCQFDRFGAVSTTAGLPSGLEQVARGFQADWDLVGQRVDPDPPPPLRLDTTAIASLCADIGNTDCPDGDRQVELCARIAELGRRLQRSRTLATALHVVSNIAAIKPGRIGNKANWRHAAGDLETVRDRQRELAERADELLGTVRQHRKQLIGAVVGTWIRNEAKQRRADGRVLFHDLLVLARQLVARNAAVRSALHDRYQYLLLDEFQDTDPIQLEIAVRITASPDDPQQGVEGNWRRLRPLPGRLFIVGDPKQSIYRFRRADIGQYLAAAAQLDARQVQLTANFRSTNQVIEWVNSVFGELITPEPNTQAAFTPLVPARSEPNSFGSVHLLGSTGPVSAQPIEDHACDPTTSSRPRVTAEQLRDHEAHAVADAVCTVLTQRWKVRDHDQLRGCVPGDICILVPARTSLPQLQRALDAAGVPYRAENSSVVYTTTEVRNVMTVLHAADDPSDHLRLVAALRSPLFGISDVELFGWRSAGGTWSLWSATPPSLSDHPVAEAMEVLRAIARIASEFPPADLITEVVDRCRVLESALDASDARDVWRRIRYATEQARSWSDAGGHGLRRYLRWVARQASEARTGDTVLPEHDHDAVRIMTVHAAKGREFPITILSGMTSEPRHRYGKGVIWTEDSWAITHRGDNAFEEYQPIDEQMNEAERERLLYVAATRAADHLVVSCVHKQRAERSKRTNAELLLAASDTLRVPELAITAQRWVPHLSDRPPLAHAEHEDWEAERSVVLRAASRRHAVSATTLAKRGAVELTGRDDPGLEKEPVDLDLPPWQRGRYGTAVGRAVHAVLQFCDLQTGADLDAYAAAQCAAEGILGMEATVAGLARSALAAPIVRQAASTRHHRELYVAAPVGAVTIEGYIDLFVESADGGVIVDYKTDRFADDHERSSRLETYRLQLATYAVALESVLQRPIARAVLVRCRSDEPAEQIAVEAWEEAIKQVHMHASVAATSQPHNHPLRA